MKKGRSLFAYYARPPPSISNTLNTQHRGDLNFFNLRVFQFHRRGPAKDRYGDF